MNAESSSWQICAQFFAYRYPSSRNQWYTLLVLIAKTMSLNFAPTSLCNIGCRVITNTLTNRLKNIMPSYNQNSFIPDRQLHSMDTKKNGTRWTSKKLTTVSNGSSSEKHYKSRPFEHLDQKHNGIVWKGKFLDWFT